MHNKVPFFKVYDGSNYSDSQLAFVLKISPANKTYRADVTEIFKKTTPSFSLSRLKTVEQSTHTKLQQF